jgi:hypothetical protein
VARAMISDDAIVSGLVLALLGDALVWRKSGDWSWPLCCLALQFGITAVVAIAGECWMSRGKELRRWGIWNSRNREDRDPGRLA